MYRIAQLVADRKIMINSGRVFAEATSTQSNTPMANDGRVVTPSSDVHSLLKKSPKCHDECHNMFLVYHIQTPYNSL